MSNILLNIIIITVIFVPMAYFMFSGNKDKARANNLKEKLQPLGFSPYTLGFFQSGSIALDKEGTELCFCEEGSDNIIKTHISQLSSAEVSKHYKTESVHDHDINILKSVTLLLKKKDKTEVKLPVFNIANHPNVGTDLMEAVTWSERINKLIK